VPFLKIQRGEAEFVGTNSYNTDVFVVPWGKNPNEDDSTIL